MAAEQSDDGPGDGQADGPGAGGEWVTVAEAARRLRVTPRAIRNRIARGTIPTKPAGNMGRLVRVTPGDTTQEDQGDGPEDDPGEAYRAELERMREELLEARVAAVRAEAERDAAREVLAEVRKLLDDARRPWWRRWRG